MPTRNLVFHARQRTVKQCEKRTNFMILLNHGKNSQGDFGDTVNAGLAMSQ